MIELRKKKDFTVEVFTSSMNDIMFFLMLFFIITSTLLNPSMIKVSLPSSRSSQSIQKREINLTMTKDKVYYVDNTQVPFGSLEAQLKKELTRYPDAFIMLRFDNTLPIQDLVNVLSLGNNLNAKMIIATAKSH
ncbi:MAG: biopolymer transporter ExbD [Bacteroidales bacterium]